MFTWLTFDSLTGMATNWLGILAIPLGFVVGIAVVGTVLTYLIGLVPKKEGGDGPTRANGPKL